MASHLLQCQAYQCSLWSTIGRHELASTAADLFLDVDLGLVELAPPRLGRSPVVVRDETLVITATAKALACYRAVR
jgi:hypothetical protein